MENFVNAPQQSAMLQQTGLMPPPALTDQECHNPAIVGQRCEDAANYYKRVKYDLSQGRAISDDVDEAAKFGVGVSVATHLTGIHRNLAPVGANALADIIMPMIDQRFALVTAQINTHTNERFALAAVHSDARFAQAAVYSDAQLALLNLQLGNMNVMHKNSFSDRNEGPIRPLRQVPELPPLVQGQPYPGLPAPEPLPPNFPATRGALLNLQHAQINPFLDYYGITYNGNNTLIPEKHALLLDHLGLPPIR